METLCLPLVFREEADLPTVLQRVGGNRGTRILIFSDPRKEEPSLDAKLKVRLVEAL